MRKELEEKEEVKMQEISFQLFSCIKKMVSKLFKNLHFKNCVRNKQQMYQNLQMQNRSPEDLLSIISGGGVSNSRSEKDSELYLSSPLQILNQINLTMPLLIQLMMKQF